MNVLEIMTTEVTSCSPDSTLATVASLMWSENIGSVVAVDSRGVPVGIVTDRDIAMACFLNHRSLWDLRVQDVISGQKLRTCHPDDSAESAIGMMRAHEIRRLPVVDGKGRLSGILSLGDLVAAAEAGTGRKKPALPLHALDPAFRAVFAHHARTPARAPTG